MRSGRGDGVGVRPARRAGGPELAPAGGFGRPGAGGTAVPPAALGRDPSHGAGSRLRPSGTPTSRRDDATSVARVPEELSRGLPLQPVLRSVSPLRPQAVTHDAPGPPGRGEGFRRFLR